MDAMMCAVVRVLVFILDKPLYNSKNFSMQNTKRVEILVRFPNLWRKLTTTELKESV